MQMMASYINRQPDQEAARVVILDSQPVVNLGLASVIASRPQYRICGTADNIDDALRLISQHSPNLVIAGLRFDEASGMQLIRQLRDRWANLLVLVLASYDERVFAERVLRAGANGYIMTNAEPDEILDAMQSVLDGNVYVSQQVASTLMHALVNGNNNQSPLAKLSDREIEVYELIGRGLSVREIAHMFRRSTKTVEAHREHIKLKLGVSSSHDLSRHAAQWMLSHAGSSADSGAPV
jgi:DNA-binding NarL/FixJ family response regulator